MQLERIVVSPDGVTVKVCLFLRRPISNSMNRGVAWVDDTNTKVVEVALDMIAHGWSPEEIHFQHPHLSLAQIHAALGYYYDHKANMDNQIQRSVKDVEKLRAQAGESPIRKRLREAGTLR
jgi:uncharacterized protein (DUF433 family)